MKLIESFFWGIVAALGALIVELVIFIAFSAWSNQALDISFFQLFTMPKFLILGVLIEEIFKYLIISKRVDTYSLGRSYLTNSFFVGFGFFATELALILNSSQALPPLNLLSEIAIIHIGTAGLIGFAVATKNPKRVATFLSAIIFASLFHGAYNLLTLNRTFILNQVIFGVLGILLFFNLINIFRIKKQLA